MDLLQVNNLTEIRTSQRLVNSELRSPIKRVVVLKGYANNYIFGLVGACRAYGIYGPGALRAPPPLI